MYANHRWSAVRKTTMLLLFVSVMFRPSFALQAEVKIIIDGPWAYVADPADPQNRIIVISPVAPNHRDYVELKPKPSGHNNEIGVGVYRLEIPNFSPSQCTTTASNAFLYPINVKSSAIQQALTSVYNRYLFSIPKPCFYKEKDHTFSKVSQSPILTPADQVEGDPYTMRMELHYSVPSVVAATLTGSSDDHMSVYNDSVGFTGRAITFTMAADIFGGNDESMCDSTSADSFLATVSLFGENRYVWFPFLDDYGNQAGNKGYFLDGCQKNKTRLLLQKNMVSAQVALKDIEVIQRYAAHPVARDEGSVLHAFGGLSKAVESLAAAQGLPARPGDPQRPPIEPVRKEISSAMERLGFAAAGSADQRRDNPEPVGRNSKNILMTTYDFVVFSASGSGDCHGGQVGVNGIP